MPFRRLSYVFLSFFLAAAFLGCGADSQSKPDEDKSSAAIEKPDEESKPKARTIPKRRDRPLPAIQGRTLEGKEFSITNHLGKRAVLYFFDAGHKEAAPGAEAIAAIAPFQSKNNFQIIGISNGENPMMTSQFAGKYSFDFPIVMDPDRIFLQRFRMRESNAMVGMDPEGYFSFIHGVPHGGEDPAQILTDQLFDSLRIAAGSSASSQTHGEFPLAPDFTAGVLVGEETHTLSSYRGKPVIVMFFLHTCPHCHKALEFLKTALPKIPEENRPVLLAFEISGKRAGAQAQLNKDGFDFFPALADPGREIANSFGAMGSVPDIYLINPEGKIVDHLQGWRDLRDPPIFQMKLSKLAQIPVPMLLNKQGFSGTEFCIVCHESETRTWEFTKHSAAFDTLVKHGDDHDAECVTCHVVGDGEPGGFLLNTGTTYMEDVGCESCHGQGGPHISPDFVKEGDFEPVCKTCHNPKHSLGFNYPSFVSKISHKANAHLLSLSAEERDKLLAERGLERKPPSGNADFVGSDACQSCHSGEYETWSKGPHAHAVDTLRTQGEESKSDCLACHTTGFGRSGGFPKEASVTDHSDLARVGCESCHGPGANHIPVDTKKVGTILSLGDKCDSCVILSICGSCHDDANDPEFEFEVQDKIDKIRHGTIEPAAGLPPQSDARHELSTSTIAGLLEQGFSALP